MTDFDRFYDGEMDDAEQRELAAQLRDPTVARAFIAAAADEWSLQQAARGRQRLGPGVGREAAPSSRFSQQTWLLAAIGLLSLSGSLVFWFASPSSTATATPAPAVEAPAPTVPETLRVTGSDLPPERAERLATELLAGRPATVPPDTRLRIALPDAAGKLDLQGPAQLARADRRHWHLAHGALDAQITHDGAGWRVTTPQSSCRVLGTRFQLQSDTIATRVQVTDGVVRCGPPGGAWIQEVAAGERYTSLSHTAAVYYPFAGEGAELLQPIDAGDALTDHRPARRQAGGLLLDGEHHCVTPANQPQPALVAGMTAQRGLTMAVRIEALDPLPEYLLLLELYLQLDAPDENGEERRTMQLRHLGQAPAGSHLYVAVYDDDRVRLYRDGERYRSFTRAMPWDDLRDEAQVKLLQPSKHHDNPPDLPRIVYRDLWIFDRALSEAELRHL